MNKDKKQPKSYHSQNRRQSSRLEIEDYFSLTLKIASEENTQSCRIKDISKSGMRFTCKKIEKIKLEEIINVRLYVNNILYLPLALKIMRVGETGIGCEFVNQNSIETKAIAHFINFLESAEPILRKDMLS